MTSKLSILEHMHDVYQKKSLTPKDIISDNIFFLLLTIWPLMTMIWPLMNFFFDLLTSRIDSIIITKNIWVLHIKWKLKTSVLQWKYVQTSHCRSPEVNLRSVNLPQIHMVKSRKKDVVTNDILGCSVFFYIHHAYVPKC